MSLRQHKITREAAISLAQALLRRHSLKEYTDATKKLSDPNEPRLDVARRAKLSHKNTNSTGTAMDLDDLSSLSISEDKDNQDYWKINWLIQPFGEYKRWDGLATPVTMKISKITGKINDFWADLTF